ncbi:N-acetylmuramoyl-L-alanine amidase CwlD [Alteribacillus sp. HJP-4]|uniref:N-acetylmuramoyl-L-alanine amidase CwlD n=1 Tax=Alteribacillus sp. HJP-4 TaxID=2775394 RepID=UPI0035CCD4D1
MKKWLIFAILIIVLAAVFNVMQNRFTTMDTAARWQTPLSGKVIVLDAGHGGVDAGASSRSGVMEKEVALNTTLMLRDYLQEAGALVLLTREGDYDLAGTDVRGYSKRKTEDLYKRAEIVNESGADLYVSMHLNAIPGEQWSGAQTFYHSEVPLNEHIAFFIQEELKNSLENTTRTAKPIDNIFILEQADIPGALVEIGFLSNPGEAANLGDRAYQDKVAVSIYRGLLRHFSGEKLPE